MRKCAASLKSCASDQPTVLLTMLLLSPKCLVLFLSIFSATMVSAKSSHSSLKHYSIYATTNSHKMAKLLFTPPNNLNLIEDIQVGEGQSWITFDKDSRHGYVLGNNVSIINLDEDGKCKQIGNSKGYSTGGDEPVASCIVDNCLFVANYGSGSASIFPLSTETHLPTSSPKIIQYTRKGIGAVTSRQDKCYAHDATASPDRGWVYICDLGSDQIHHIKVNKDNCFHSREQESTNLALGSGPRHLSFYKDEKSGKQYAYLASELASTVTAFHHDPTTGKLTQIGEPLLTVPKGVALGGDMTAGPVRTTAEVIISPNGQQVYVSNRGDDVEDHITIFQRNTDGSLNFQEWVPSGGLMPRHFSMSQDGAYIAVAHQTSNSVVILERNAKTGSLQKTGAVMKDLDSTKFAGFYPPQPYV